MTQTAVIHDDGMLRIVRTRGSRGYELHGEIDIQTHDALDEALAGLVGPGDVRLDLTGLEFCDAAGLGAMVALTDRVGQGGRLVLDGVGPQLRKMLSVLRWDRRPNLVIRHRPPRHPGLPSPGGVLAHGGASA